LEEISRNEEAVKISQEKEALRVEIARLELENDRKKLAELSGKQSTA
jgi:translation initiation factor IF-1